VGLGVDHDPAGACEDERERADRFGDEGARERRAAHRGDDSPP
jgi:hypothetical protein